MACPDDEEEVSPCMVLFHLPYSPSFSAYIPPNPRSVDRSGGECRVTTLLSALVSDASIL